MQEAAWTLTLLLFPLMDRLLFPLSPLRVLWCVLRSQSSISLPHAMSPVLRSCMLSDEGPHTLCDRIYVTNAGVYVDRHIEKKKKKKKSSTRLMPCSTAESADLVLVRIISGRNSEVLERACSVSERGWWLVRCAEAVCQQELLLIPALKHSLLPHPASVRKTKLDYVFFFNIF